MEVTDEMVDTAKRMFLDGNLCSPYSDISVKLRMILEAVFAMVEKAPSSDNSTQLKHPASEPEEDNQGWIEWKGGECPVSDDIIVEVKYKSPRPSMREISQGKAGYKAWHHSGAWCDIIVYRIIKEEPKEKVPTLMDCITSPAGLNALDHDDLFRLLSEYLDKYMMRKD